MVFKVRDLIISTLLKIGSIELTGTSNGNVVLDGERTIATAIDDPSIYGKTLYLDSNMELKAFDGSVLSHHVYIDEVNGRSDNSGDENSPLDSFLTLASRTDSLSPYSSINIVLLSDCTVGQNVFFGNLMSLSIGVPNGSSKKNLYFNMVDDTVAAGLFVDGGTRISIDSIYILAGETIQTTSSAISGSPREVILLNSEVSTSSNFSFIDSFSPIDIALIDTTINNDNYSIVENDAGTTVTITLNSNSSISNMSSNIGSVITNNNSNSMSNINVLS